MTERQDSCTAYQSWSVVFGEQPSAAKWNILGTNDASFNDGTGIGTGAITPGKWTNPYCFRATTSGATTLTDNTDVQVLFATEDYDYNNNFASSTYTAPVAGVYGFKATAGISGAVATGVDSYISLRKNDAAIAYGTRIVPGNNATHIIATDLLLAANDTVKVYFFQDSAGNEATLADVKWGHFSGHLIHAT